MRNAERGQRELSRFGRDPGFACSPDYNGPGLRLEFIVEDEGVFTKPWSAAISYRRPLGRVIGSTGAAGRHNGKQFDKYARVSPAEGGVKPECCKHFREGPP